MKVIQLFIHILQNLFVREFELQASDYARMCDGYMCHCGIILNPRLNSLTTTSTTRTLVVHKACEGVCARTLC